MVRPERFANSRPIALEAVQTLTFFEESVSYSGPGRHYRALSASIEHILNTASLGDALVFCTQVFRELV
jgi:hypothetical protein